MEENRQSKYEAAEAVPQWFVLRCTYSRELPARRRIEEEGIECFVPMKHVRRRDSKGRFHRIEVPVVHNFIFVKTFRSEVNRLKMEVLPYLRYMMVRDGDERRVMTVPQRQMESFMAIAGNTKEPKVFLTPDEVDLSEGDRVRIVDGTFAGVEGTFIRLKRKKGKCVVVKIDGVVAVATAELDPIMVEKID